MRFQLAVLAVLAVSSPAAAQQQQGVTSAFSGFSLKSDEPVNIEADNLEVRDQEQSAIFTGNVVMKQGESTLTSRKLTIFYYDKNKSPANAGGVKPTQGETKAPAGGATPEAGRDIRRMEAEGDVVVTQKDQRATGARGVFDTQANTADLTGGVVVTQNGNVVRGDRLHVNMTTQTSRVESGGSGRVQGVFKPRQRDQAGSAKN
ncbi:LptA/OstA family protein [Hansschlegelia beijingensis]|uniref:Lipopolysaccharide export system protein LptA n=1 Tax=Hansschlegelia beijingensis TaxID=1133344 RepID=A0A7W6CXH5_9HYPH|nr:LptA/OstA family protein [Hansschlegelia beijingensis]MBB3972906.1 lipopolysaccharide export system protein LptA [Hansschlegelia beijingensis]